MQPKRNQIPNQSEGDYTSSDFTKEVATMSQYINPSRSKYQSDLYPYGSEGRTYFNEEFYEPRTLPPRFRKSRNSYKWVWNPSRNVGPEEDPHQEHSWGVRNHGFEYSEEPVSFIPVQRIDFDHDLKNFQQGNGIIRFSKPPVGKLYRIPNPPPAPGNDSNI